MTNYICKRNSKEFVLKLKWKIILSLLKNVHMLYPKDKKIFTDVIGKIKDKYQRKRQMSHYLKWTWQFTSACKIINWKNTILEVEVAKCDGWIQDTCFKNQWLFYTLLTKKFKVQLQYFQQHLRYRINQYAPK